MTMKIHSPKILVFDVAPSRLMEMSVDYYRECQIAGAGSVEVDVADDDTTIVSATRYLPADADVAAVVHDAFSRCSARAPAATRSSCASSLRGRTTPCTALAGEPCMWLLSVVASRRAQCFGTSRPSIAMKAHSEVAGGS